MRWSIGVRYDDRAISDVMEGVVLEFINTLKQKRLVKFSFTCDQQC